MSQYNTEEIIKASLENVEALNKKLNDLDDLHNQIKQSIAESAKLPGLFQKLGSDLNNASENYLSGNNDLFKERIIEIVQKTTELSLEIERLRKVDFTISFNELGNKFLENTKNQFDKEFSQLDEKTATLKSINKDLENEVSRLSKIDLESLYEKHQNKLSEIFISINGINGILTTLSQNVIKTTQTLGDIEALLKSIEKNHESVTTQLTKLENSAESNFKSIQSQIQKSQSKHQIQTYITWALILLATITIIALK